MSYPGDPVPKVHRHERTITVADFDGIRWRKYVACMDCLEILVEVLERS